MESATSDLRFALIAVIVFLAERVVTSLIFIFDSRVALLQRLPAIPLTGVVFSWALPILIVHMVEKRGLGSLGLAVGREKHGAYAIYAFVGLVLPAFLVKVDASLISEFIDQIVYIGLAEEVFFRGYLMRRLSDWLGERGGLLLSAAIFGSSHIVSRVSQHGFDYLLGDAMTGAQTFLGGLLLGYIYLRAGDIVPGSIFHISTNAYIGRLVEAFTG